MPDLGNLIGLYGAILATVLGLSQWRRNRKPLRISLDQCLSGTRDDDGFKPDDGPETYCIRVVNRGPTPITIESFGIGYRIDYRRAPIELIGALSTMLQPFKVGNFRLDVFGHVEGRVPIGDINGRLHGSPLVQREGVDGWFGTAPRRIDYVWAADVTGHTHTNDIEGTFKQTGYYPEDTDQPPILRGQLMAAWLRGCMALCNTYGSGPRIVNALHRLRLFPVEVE